MCTSSMRRNWAEGRYGCVMLGKHKVTGMTRAIKSVSKLYDDLRGLTQEISLIKRMDHPNIIKLFETFEDQHKCTLVMELCEGGTLLDRTVEAGYLSEGDAASAVRDMLRVAFYMHQQSLVLPELKPQNFMLLNSGPIANNVLKLIDFSTARSATHTSMLTSKIGTPLSFAPQMGKGHRKRDIWSCGAITYFLLCGNPPFAGVSDSENMEKVGRVVLSFKEPAWQAVSAKAKTFVQKFIRTNAQERSYAEQALSHEWIAEYAPKKPLITVWEEDEEAEIDFMDTWRNYRSANKLKRAALHVLAHQMDNAETRRLQDTFIALDAEDNGWLSREELRQPLLTAGRIKCDDDLDDIIDAVDMDGSGVIDYTEFIAAGIYSSKAIDETACRTAFSFFDRDDDGELSTEELAEVLDRGTLKDSTAIVVHKVDRNKDGKISFNEFLQMMDMEPSTRATTPNYCTAEGCSCGGESVRSIVSFGSISV